MTRLPVPVRRALDTSVDPHEVDAAARRIALRTRASRATWPLLAAAGALLAITVGTVAVFRATAPSALALAGGAAVPARLDRSVAFDDASRIDLEDGASIDVLRNDAASVELLLARGTATFDVHPGGPRTWTIECGLATVSVVGTRFTIERGESSLAVRVERGAVVVRGPRVEGGARRLEAGEALAIEPERPPVVEAAPAIPEAQRPPEPPAAEEPGPTAPPRVPVRAPARASWRAHADDARWEEAWDDLGERGIADATERSSADDLLALADVARLSGHPASAVAPLERLVADHASDARAPLAAFSLGRVEDQLGHPDRAARAFERAVALGLPGDLRLDAIARAAIAHDRSGAVDQAHALAARYLADAPEGRHAAAMRAIGAER